MYELPKADFNHAAVGRFENTCVLAVLRHYAVPEQETGDSSVLIPVYN